MKPPKIRAAHGPEYGIQREIINFLRVRKWHVERIVGIGWQFGLPDLYIAHPQWGQRWLEVKNDGEYTFTKAQKIKFPILASFGVGIWIMTAATEEQYERLFKEPNWRDYWKKSWGQINIDALLEELNASQENDS